MKRIISVLLSLVMLLSAFSVMGIPVGATDGETQIYLADDYEEIYLTGTVQIEVGVINPVGEVEFVSSDERIASVTKDGLVTGKSKGEATITVKNNGVEEYFSVIVKNPQLSIYKKTFIAGEIATVKIIGQVGNAEFSSSNKKIATINSKGVLKTNRAGSTIIRVKTNGGSFALRITVKEGLKINKKQLYLYKGKKYQLKATGSMKVVKWTSTNKKVADVSKTGKITAKNPGSATIKVSTGTKTVNCKVFVYKKTKEVQNRVKLKKYIVKNGVETKDGDKMISGTTSTGDGIKIDCGVVYLEKSDKLVYTSVFYFDDGNMIINMPVSVGNNDKAKVQCYMTTTDNSSYFYSQKTINIKDYTIKKDINFAKKQYENVTNESIKVLSNGTLQISFKAWNKLIKKYGKSSMVKMGFSKWNK